MLAATMVRLAAEYRLLTAKPLPGIRVSLPNVSFYLPSFQEGKQFFSGTYAPSFLLIVKRGALRVEKRCPCLEEDLY